METDKTSSLRTSPEAHNTQFLEAMATYRFVGQFIKGGRVLDAACAYGYGTDHIAGCADHVIGVDFEPSVVAWARKRYRRGNVAFLCCDLHDISCKDASFDVVCFFETIHIVRDYWVVLKEIHRVLKPGGMFYVTTRRAAEDAPEPDAFHRHQFTTEMIENVLRSCGFHNFEAYGMDRPKDVYTLEKRLCAVRAFDRLGVKRFIPRPLISGIVYLVSRLSGLKPPQELDPGDFVIAKDIVDTGRGLLVSCRKAG